MTTREQFLDRVRRRLEKGLPDNPLRPVARVANDPIDYTPDLTSPVDAFISAAPSVNVEVVGAADESVEVVLDRVFDRIRPRIVTLSGDPECSGLDVYIEALGATVIPAHDASAVADADLGITGAVAGVALTGSVVVDSRRAGGRLPSLVPRHHLILLPANKIVATPGDIFRAIDSWTPGGLPSNLVVITGPSRSADIELQLTLGVHGPQGVFVALR